MLLVGDGSGVVLVGGVIGTVTDVPVNAGPNIAVPVNVGSGVMRGVPVVPVDSSVEDKW